MFIVRGKYILDQSKINVFQKCCVKYKLENAKDQNGSCCIAYNAPLFVNIFFFIFCLDALYI